MSENENSKRLTISDIESKYFHRAAYGYEQKEVDEFLDCICDEMEKLQGEIAELNRKLDYANAETRKAEAASGVVAPVAVVPDDSFREILEMAQRVKEQTISDAQQKAEEIVAEAKAQAEAELGGLEEERDRLQEIVRSLREKAGEYRTTVAKLISAHQEALDAIDLGEDEE